MAQRLRKRSQRGAAIADQQTVFESGHAIGELFDHLTLTQSSAAPTAT
jgi:hypothetical protein